MYTHTSMGDVAGAASGVFFQKIMHTSMGIVAGAASGGLQYTAETWVLSLFYAREGGREPQSLCR